jgi:hypothetical protein
MWLDNLGLINYRRVAFVCLLLSLLSAGLVANLLA